ncbi:MAG: hypothetical protein QNJ44_08250 [Rhodobacter sp.]|nr:hypothetical protein [Rhodobacter sp.]
MSPIWFVRMTRWVRNPPSMGRVKMVLAIVAACLVLYGLERMFGWPDWLTPERFPSGRVMR